MKQDNIEPTNLDPAKLQKQVADLTEEVKSLKNLINTNKEILTLSEAAAFLGLTKSALYKMTHLQTIPYFKPSNKLVYFERTELLNWVRQNPISSKAQIREEAQRVIQSLSM